MAIVMMTELPGADTAFAEGMRQAGVVAALQGARGFRGHWSGATRSGYRVIELWDSREDCQAFADGNIAPNLPAGIQPPLLEFFELNFEIKPAGIASTAHGEVYARMTDMLGGSIVLGYLVARHYSEPLNRRIRTAAGPFLSHG
jgi:hypothetical protein